MGLGGGTGTTKPIKYGHWNIFVENYSVKDVEKRLVNVFEGFGLERGNRWSSNKNVFSKDGLEVRLDNEKGARVRITVDLYSRDRYIGEETQKIIQNSIDGNKDIIKSDYYPDLGDGILK